MSNTESFFVVGRPSSVLWFTACCLVLASILAGCSDFGFFRPKLDPNAYPASYRTDLVAYVRIHPVDVLDARHGPAVTLVSCFPFEYVGSAPLRFIVRAVVVDETRRLLWAPPPVGSTDRGERPTQ